jgi:hypothetical protein
MVTIYLFGWLAGVWKDARTILIPISCIPVVVGALMIWLASWKNRAVPLVGFYLLASFGAPYVLLLSLSSANGAYSVSIKRGRLLALTFSSFPPQSPAPPRNLSQTPRFSSATMLATSLRLTPFSRA